MTRRATRSRRLRPAGFFALGGLASLLLALAWVPLRAGRSDVIAAMVLLVVTTGCGLSTHRSAVLGSTLSAALAFTYFDTIPYDRMSIAKQSDIATAVSLGVVGLLTGELAVRVSANRRSEVSAVGYLDRVRDAAARLAAGEDLVVFIGKVAAELRSVMSAASCEYSAEELPAQAAVVSRAGQLDEARTQTSPRLAVPVVAMGRTQGHFILDEPAAERLRPSALRVCVTLADQVGAALAAHGTLPPTPPNSRLGDEGAGQPQPGPRLRLLQPGAGRGPSTLRRRAG